jgi:hypothetical protein
MSAPEPTAVRRGRVKLLLIFALFVAPPLGAWFAWQYVDEHGVDATTNMGTLVSPVRPVAAAGLATADGTVLPDGALRGRWTYVLFAPAGCGEACREQLYLTRQVRLAVNKDVSRVQRMLVLPAAPTGAAKAELDELHPDLRIVLSSSPDATFAAPFHGEAFAPDGTQYFLLDPLGNLMMRYADDAPGKGVLKDLRKLLKVSQIG